MATLCRNLDRWIRTDVEQPMEQWENQQERRCRAESCNWWTLCLNVVFCWVAWIVVKVVRMVLVRVLRLIAHKVCVVVSAVLDVAALFVNLVLSVPVIGSLRTVLNWVTEIVWRVVGLVDLALGVFGVRPRKKMYVGLLIPRRDGAPITTEAAMMPQIQRAQALYLSLCNVELVYTGVCDGGDAPGDALVVPCDARGFLSDWWVGGSYLQATIATCRFGDGWRRLLGYGGEIVVVAVSNVLPDTPDAFSVGCSFTATHDHVVVEPGVNVAVAAHEIGHACLLPHTDDATNLMFDGGLSATPTLSATQVALVRWSKHCVYF